MTTIVFKTFKHRKATSDCIANSSSQATQSPTIVNGKAVCYFPKNKHNLPTIEKNNDNNPQLENNQKQNTKKNSKKNSTKYEKGTSQKEARSYRSNSFDKYFLPNDKQQQHQKHQQQHTTLLSSNVPHVPSPSQKKSSYHHNSHMKVSYKPSQKSQKMMMTFNSPFLKKHFGMMIKKPTENNQEEKNNLKNHSISMEEYFKKTISPFGIIQTISLMNKQGNSSLFKDSHHHLEQQLQQISKKKQDSNKKLFITKHNTPLLTIHSDEHSNNKLKKSITQMKQQLSSRTIDPIKANNSKEKISKEIFLGDNFNRKEINENGNAEKKKEIHITFIAKSKLKIEREEDLKPNIIKSNKFELIFHNSHTTIAPPKINLTKNDLSNISLKYQDIIQNNINYSKNNTANKTTSLNSTSYTNKRIIDYDVNKTPQITKFTQFYPHAKPKKEHSNNNTNNTDDICEENELAHNIPQNHIQNEKKNKKVIFINMTTVQLPNKHNQKEKEHSKSTEQENNETLDIETECLFDGEEKNELEVKRNIPVFPIKLFNYKYSTKPKHTSLERMFKKRCIYPVILLLLDYKSLSMLCMCNHYLRKKLKKVQYESAKKMILNYDAKEEGAKNKIKKSVFSYSNLCNDSFLSRTYLNYAYSKCKYNDDIQKDLTRTFPDDDSFKFRNKNYTNLYQLLTAYANYNNNIGYAQGLNFLAGHSIFAFDKPEEVFIFIDGLIIKFELEQLFGVKNRLKEKIDKIGSLLKQCAPYVISYLEDNGLGHEFFTANWLLTLFSNSMRRKYLFCIWDFMIVFGKRFFNYFIVAIMIKYSTKILSYDQSLLSQLMKGLLKSETFENEFELIITQTFELMRIYCI